MTVATKLTTKKRKKFLKTLAETGNVTQACRHIGAARQSIYQLRDRDEKFKAAWASALETAADTLEEEARRRALGWKEDRYTNDGRSYTVEKNSDLLMIFLLKGMRPEKYRERHSVDGTVKTENTVIYIPDNKR